MNVCFRGVIALLLSLPAALFCQGTPGQTVRFHTNLGDIDVNLLPDAAPNTVANFLNYMGRGLYNSSVIHRSVPGFVIQGGGYQWTNRFITLQQFDPVANEFKISNTRGTLAMALAGSDPNSATSQWFFNLADNSTNLDDPNLPFTVFGRVANDAGLAVMDAIANVPVPNPAVFASPFDQMPLINYKGGNLTAQNLVLVLSVGVLGDPPVIKPNGVASAGNFGGYSSAAPGSYVEIYGSDLAGPVSRGWTSADFISGKAPTYLDGVTVTVGGQPAYVNYVSSTQVNVQVPANVPIGTQPVIVDYQGRQSAPAMIPIKPLAGGLLAPASFNVGGKQYVAAFHAKGAFVGSGNIPGVPAAPALPGETLIFYGIGFGPVTPTSVPIAGQVVQVASSLATPVQFKIGSIDAQVAYAGLAPTYVGFYQFNVTVPADAKPGDLLVEVMQGGATVPQSLYLPVGSSTP